MPAVSVRVRIGDALRTLTPSFTPELPFWP